MAKAPLVSEAEKLRKVLSYCRHDLRTSIGSAQTSLDILKEDLKIEDPELEGFLTQAYESLKSGLAELDRIVDENKESVNYLWVLSKDEHDFIQSRDDLIIFYFSDWASLKQRMSDYRPDLLILDSELLPALDRDFLVSNSLAGIRVLLHQNGLSDESRDLLQKFGLKDVCDELSPQFYQEWLRSSL